MIGSGAGASNKLGRLAKLYRLFRIIKVIKKGKLKEAWNKVATILICSFPIVYCYF